MHQVLEKVGFIGLGNMGRPMAANLCRKGFALFVHDVNPVPVRALQALGAHAEHDPAAVTRHADVVITMLPNSEVVEDVILGPAGVLKSLKPGAVVIDMSTIGPAMTDRVAAETVALGGSFVDAPVGRLASHAERGESLFMVGADDATFQRVKPILEAMGTTIHHCGPAGAGTRTKLVNNYLAIISCQLNAEAIALSQRFGLTLEKTLDVLYGTTATNGQLKIAWPSKVLKGDTEPGFTIDLAYKDLTLIVEAGADAHVPMPVAAAARDAFAAAREHGYGSKDFSVMVDVLCDSAGIARPRFSTEKGTESI